MRNTLVAIVMVVMLPASVAAAEPTGARKPENPANSGALLPTKGAGSGNNCAAYGPGFAKVDGTESCMKIGGSIRAGGSARYR
jgi:Porin subfamily